MKHTLKILLFLAALFVVAALAGAWFLGMGHNSAAVNTARWLLRASHYKAEVLAQPDSDNRQLKHIEWDGWGWAGQDTTVYLVFDPTDSLSKAASTHQPGTYNGIPCEVFVIRRLETNWYTVQFYTDEWWGRRNELSCTGSE